MQFWADVGGHAWTVWPHLRDRFRPPPVPESTLWTGQVSDPSLGVLKLSGRIDHVPGARGIVVILHGMGGSAERTYCAMAAAVARASGLSSLRLNMRGADGSGEDLYHIGLVDDLEAAIADPVVAGYERVYALGFSLGGHIALRLAGLGRAGVARAVASVCPPLDLEASCDHMDKVVRWPYRMHVLGGIKEVYRHVAARRAVATPLDRVLAIRSIREWDERVVSPRFGFAGASDYYRQVSVQELLPEMALPTLLVASQGDPMIPSRTLRPVLSRASSAVEVRWQARGGHVGFPSETKVMSAIMEWLARH